jgi:gliding motility-associated-like protein
VDVILKLKALGCEADSQTVIKKVQVNKAGAGIRYRTITVPEGSTQYIHSRNLNGLSPVWKPQVQLSNYNTQYTQFFANGNDVDYRIEMTDVHTCVVVDSILMQILKKPGYYLPTAFTPNGDGLNDIAIPYLVRMKSLKSFSVFNRSGTLIFYTRKEGEGWDGKYKGVPQENGVYVWMLEFVNNNDETITEKGTITIIR